MIFADAPLYKVIIFAAFCLGVFGFLIAMFLPREWQNTQGWLIVSFLGIPGFLLAFALVVNVPGLLIGGAFLLGMLALSKR